MTDRRHPQSGQGTSQPEWPGPATRWQVPQDRADFTPHLRVVATPGRGVLLDLTRPAIRSWHLQHWPLRTLGPPTREFVLLARPGQFAGALLLAGVLTPLPEQPFTHVGAGRLRQRRGGQPRALAVSGCGVGDRLGGAGRIPVGRAEPRLQGAGADRAAGDRGAVLVARQKDPHIHHAAPPPVGHVRRGSQGRPVTAVKARASVPPLAGGRNGGELEGARDRVRVC